MRTTRSTRFALLLAAALPLASCATNFSPELIRSEIARQRGVDPLGVFELNLGRFTTLLIRSAMAGEDGVLPFAGLESLQVAVYQAPSESGPAIDVTRIEVFGWEPVVRLHNSDRSGLLLIRGAADAIADLVVVGAGSNKVVYARLRGTLDRELPGRLGRVLSEGGADEVERILTELGGDEQ